LLLLILRPNVFRLASNFFGLLMLILGALDYIFVTAIGYR
jgi:hypothetical protein